MVVNFVVVYRSGWLALLIIRQRLEKIGGVGLVKCEVCKAWVADYGQHAMLRLGEG